ncbi:hypothetical protein LCGC14_0549620 [marine sediment metagenome]|uniref:Uncharacterized protein n=1 Tax=marine sediment metagenome TaxID=412755 RepID=A0A0F9RQA8_9ZZZZ
MCEEQISLLTEAVIDLFWVSGMIGLGIMFAVLLLAGTIREKRTNCSHFERVR